MAIPRHPRRRVLLAVHRMTGAAFAADIALEAGMERAEAVQHLRRLKSGGLVVMLKVSRTGRARWLKTSAVISPDLIARDLAERLGTLSTSSLASLGMAE